MLLFSESFIKDVRRLPGASYSFLRHVCSPDGENVRRWLQSQVSRVDAPVAERWADTLTSLDNRRFFQGFAEIATCDLLVRSGWTLEGLSWPGPVLPVLDPTGRPFHVLVLAFIRQTRPGPDRAVLERLARTINRVGARSRVIVMIRRWLPHDFDPEPVRRAIDLWLTDVDRSTLNSKYATYDDEHVSLEFALANVDGGDRHGVVLFSMGPFLAQRTVEILETRMVFELDSYRMGSRKRPVLVNVVADQPWCISDGYMRDLLLGKPVRQSTSGDARSFELTYGPAFSPSLFRDPLYKNVSGVVTTERLVDDPLHLASRGYLSPWAEAPLEPSHLGCDSLAVTRHEEGKPVLRWFSKAT